MKTKKHFPVIILSIILLIGINTFATPKNFNFEDEAYINDIPFDTEKIVNELSKTEFEDEAYIDDIPFDTEAIVIIYKYNKAVGELFELEDEADIKDIPFNTASVVANYKYQTAININFDFNEENSIDDIPFNTAMIACFNNEAYSCNLIFESY